MTRIITNTTERARHDWPADYMIQGGASGVVLREGKAYRTAFVEAFPNNPDTFLRGEGATIAEAEDACWARYEKYESCDHGDYQRGRYRNGAGFCGRCRTFFPFLFEPLPGEAPAERSLFDRALLGGDPSAALSIIDLVTHADRLPLAPEAGEDR